MKPTKKGKSREDLTVAARRVRLLLMDCDGVMTDGRIYLLPTGEELKVFHVHDGQGIAAWHAQGFETGIISGRGARSVLKARAGELGMRYLKTDSRDKLADFRSILEASGVAAAETAYVGDDVGDIPVLDAVGFPVAVANAVPALEEHVVCRTSSGGGHGAIREIVEFLLDAKRDGR